ncbi:hypothetical protein K502DRAFT_342820 [Neoconidiobolus thromboides FSU 785]|nr:hypothetical protein K502DRAFT_342820 [Neoconidiobolus thromboides FSU 785]
MPQDIKSNLNTPLMDERYVNYSEGEEGNGRAQGSGYALIESGESELKQSIDDPYCLLYITFFMLGVAMLLPWNVFITATSFFSYKFKNSRYETNFNGWFSVIGSTTNLLFLFYSLGSQRKSRLYTRSLTSIFYLTLCFIFMLIFTQTNFLPETNFYISILLLFLSISSASFLNSDGLALASTFGSNYVQASLMGQALAGLAVAIAQLGIAYHGQMNLIQLPEELILNQGYYYFLTAVMTSLLTFVCFFGSRKHPQFMLIKMELKDDHELSFSELIKEKVNECKVLINENGKLLISLLLTFIVTLSLFPAITTTITSTNNDTFISIYFIEIGFIIYNLGDLLGRYLPSISTLFITNTKHLLLASILRFLFVPLFLWSNTKLGTNHYLGNDVLFFTLMLLFATTNGYLGTMTMILGPSTTNVESRPTMASLMALTLTLGLSIGSSMSFIWLAIACQCNPF